MSDRMYFDPPSTAAQDDPRRALYARVGDLIIDTTKQRDVNPERIEKMGAWDWRKAEAVTLVERADGTLAVIEAQHRVVKLQGINPDIHIWTLVVPSEGTNEAQLSREIATARKPHNSFQKWDQDRKAGGEMQLRVQDVLESHGNLYLTSKVNNKQGSKAIAAVGAVRSVVEMPARDGGTLDDGVNLLDDTILVLASAFPSLPRKIWEGTLLKAVAGLIYRNGLKGGRGGGIDRLIEKLAAPGWTPELWLAEQAHRKPGQRPVDAVAEAMASAFNHSRRKENWIA